MLLGVDVGGTFTDAVLVDNGMIVTQAKVKTTQEEVLQGILQALDITSIRALQWQHLMLLELLHLYYLHIQPLRMSK